VKHPGYFQSCSAEQTVHFDTVLAPEGSEVKASKEAAKKINPPRKARIFRGPLKRIGKALTHYDEK
jgi:hypothetical protein